MTSAHHPSPRSKPKASKAVLRRELSDLGIKPKDAVRILPEWWEDAADDPSGIFEVRGLIAKHFGLQIGTDGCLQRRPLPHACFKTRTGTDVVEITAARAAATALARIVSAATVPSWKGGLPMAAELRAVACSRGNTPWVGLDDLLDACWSHGVPVIYMPSLPVTGAKMDGMVTFCGGRPVILITKRAAAPAWMLFDLAHEMGHIACGHLPPDEGGAIVDEKITEDAAGSDDDEREANRYALDLLAGEGRQTLSMDRLPDAAGLANTAKVYGRKHGIDPGHVILNVSKNSPIKGKEPWALANSALKFIGEDHMPADLCRDALRRNIDTDTLSDDSFEFLERAGLL